MSLAEEAGVGALAWATPSAWVAWRPRALADPQSAGYHRRHSPKAKRAQGQRTRKQRPRGQRARGQQALAVAFAGVRELALVWAGQGPESLPPCLESLRAATGSWPWRRSGWRQHADRGRREGASGVCLGWKRKTRPETGPRLPCRFHRPLFLQRSLSALRPGSLGPLPSQDQSALLFQCRVAGQQRSGQS